ncbi:hypothetical protein DPMN_181142 [Dreissena polymorpha]|uniref:Uncharacterized protein n=1 Tax=Dreissena polymorpha TaxID=45954 RepID=A0A9D4DDM6_DREPO|nr:hypothetical protein DPMN_181142 [Dreissena polymorpha]
MRIPPGRIGALQSEMDNQAMNQAMLSTRSTSIQSRVMSSALPNKSITSQEL